MSVCFAPALAYIVAVLAAAAAPLPAPAPAADPVRAALESGRYPWYDSKTDSIQPVVPPASESGEWLERLFERIGRWLSRLGLSRLSGIANAVEYLIIGLALAGLAVLIVVLVELWRRNRPPELESPQVRNRSSRRLIEGLPAGIRPETDDPWSEAVRCRERGDYQRAIVCLFAHQILTLEHLRILRVSPGRTARQLVRAIDDRRHRGPVEATLHLFEAVYYGHHVPSVEEFEAVWSLAEAFERNTLAGAVS